MDYALASTPARIVDPVEGSPRSELTAFRAVAAWQRYLAVSGHANANTARQYRRSLLNCWADLMSAEHPIEPMAITQDDVVDYLASIPAKGGARGQTLKALRSFYGWAFDRELIERSPVAKLYPRKAKYGPAPSLDPPDLDAVIAAAEQVDPRAPWAIQLQYATACRAGSLVEVLPSDIHWSGPSITFRVAKGDKPYEVPLGPKGLEAVQKLLALGDYTPVTVATRLPTLLGVRYGAYRNWVRRTSERAGIDVNSHLFRHTAITRLAEDPTIDVRTIMEIANWESPDLLRRYAAASQPRIRRAMDTL